MKKIGQKLSWLAKTYSPETTLIIFHHHPIIARDTRCFTSSGPSLQAVAVYVARHGFGRRAPPGRILEDVFSGAYRAFTLRCFSRQKAMVMKLWAYPCLNLTP